MSEKARIDVWLWRARFFKTRSLAARAVEAGSVRLMRGGSGRLVAKPAEGVGPGDMLTVAAGRMLRTVRVLALGERRGPATEARALYAEEGADLDDADRSGHFGDADVQDRAADLD
jgi:ribosome-associated heat shock protein Hsp15